MDVNQRALARAKRRLTLLPARPAGAQCSAALLALGEIEALRRRIEEADRVEP